LLFSPLFYATAAPLQGYSFFAGADGATDGPVPSSYYYLSLMILFSLSFGSSSGAGFGSSYETALLLPGLPPIPILGFDPSLLIPKFGFELRFDYLGTGGSTGFGCSETSFSLFLGEAF
jgi:hypothetical protein